VSSCYKRPETTRGCNILAEALFSQRRSGATKNFSFRCAAAPLRENLLVAHRRPHGVNDGITYSSLVQLIKLTR
jgi:hypothetical protein